LRGDVDNPRGEVLKDLAAAVQRDAKWLLFGEPSDTGLVQTRLETEAAPTWLHGMRPIPWRQVPEQDRGGVPMQAGQREPKASVVDEMLGRNVFALSVPDNSMEPEFRYGDILICDPEAPIAPGDYVVAHLHEDDLKIFRKFRPRGLLGRREEGFDLVPLNNGFPYFSVSDPARGRVIARVVGHLRRL
jgi:hypothetical protein